MTNIKRSKRTLTREQVKAFAAAAQETDAEEIAQIQARGREIFRRHERIRTLIEALKAQRVSEGLSLAEIARRCGISKPNLSRLENNTRATPTLDTLERYARALGKTVHLELAEAAAA